MLTMRHGTLFFVLLFSCRIFEKNRKECCCSFASNLKKILELFVGETSVFDNCFKSEGVESFMVWNGDPMSSVRHAYVFALGNNPEADFFKALTARSLETSVKSTQKETST